VVLFLRLAYGFLEFHESGFEAKMFFVYLLPKYSWFFIVTNENVVNASSWI